MNCNKEGEKKEHNKLSIVNKFIGELKSLIALTSEKKPINEQIKSTYIHNMISILHRIQVRTAIVNSYCTSYMPILESILYKYFKSCRYIDSKDRKGVIFKKVVKETINKLIIQLTKLKEYPKSNDLLFIVLEIEREMKNIDEVMKMKNIEIKEESERILEKEMNNEKNEVVLRRSERIKNMPHPKYA